MIDNLTFLVASENKICSYDPLYTKDTKQILKVLCESNDGSNITCVKPFGFNSLESQKILMGTEKEGINIYDQRMKTTAMKTQIPIDYGMISCISETYSKDNFYIGTIGGYLLDYDLRLNSVIRDYIYSDNIPILGIKPFKLFKNCNYDLSSIIKSQNYYLIWTAAFDHEIGLWNSYSMNCDLIVKKGDCLEFKTLEENEIKKKEKQEIDRTYPVDGMIVKTVKESKSIPHKNLILKVLGALCNFSIKEEFIEKRINSLLEREIIFRSKQDPNIFIYNEQ
jgi:hypothetical protein